MSSETVTRNDLTAILNEVLPNPADMTPQEVEDFVDGLNISGINAVDYVVEQGTSGIWTYRKWNSGIAECWGKQTGTWSVNTSATAYGGYRSTEISISAFPFTFAAAPTIISTSNSSGGISLNFVSSTTTGGVFYLCSGASSAAASRTISHYVIGTWK